MKTSKTENPSERLNNLSIEKRALLAMRALQLKKKSGRSQSQNIPRRKESGTALPLSFAQQRLWFLDQLEPNSSLYNIASAVRLKGHLNIDALEQTFNEIIRRHEILRTTFDVIGGQPLQVINPSLPQRLEPIDLSEMGEAERESEAKRLAALEARTPFDLARGPLLRITLIKLAPLDHVLLVTIHHIISDDWSVGVLIKEVAVLYDAYCSGSPSPLAELPIQYADYAVWQREWLEGAVLDGQIQYWKKQLEGAPAVLELPTDRPRPPLQSYNGGTKGLSISKRVTHRLEEIAQKQEATIYMVLMAGFQVLLMRYSGQKDIVVGTPIAGRTRGELEGLIGFFVNTLVMRSDLRGNPRFTEMVKRVKDVALGAYAHQEMPFDRLVDELGIPREMSHTPVFQVVMSMHNAPRESQEAKGLKLSRIGGERGTSKFDLTMGLMEGAEGIVGTVEYNTDLYDEATIERMISHFERLMESIARDEEQRVMAIEMLAEEERRQILREWNDTQREYPADKSIQEIFERQVKQTPDVIAVKAGEEEISYEELNRRANRMGHYLRKRGVGPEVLVAICLDRSIDLIVAVLGVLKAGGGYLPLNGDDPVERLSYMLEETMAAVVVTEERMVERLPTHWGQVIVLEEEAEQIQREDDSNPEAKASGDNVAYVMYTSGSTGKPKGVSVVNRGVVRLVKGSQYVELGAGEVILQYAPATFDASTFEIWGALLNGGRLVMMPPGVASLEELGRVIASEKITTLWLTAGLFQQMVQVNASSLSGVRQLLAGGDVLPVCEVNQVIGALTEGQSLTNGYGPTENTTFTCSYRMEKNESIKESAPIGRPITNTQVYLLDEEMGLTPVGVIGELYIGGEGLARGYVNQPEQTAERFLPDPHTQQAGARLYRTGDLVRLMPDGNIAFVGRKDNQVKVRGYRIELGEIETALMKLAKVSEAVVIAREEVGGEKRLVGYVVAEKGEQITTTEIRSHLKASLPDYMIPGLFMMIDEMPVSPNGKIDRKALPDPKQKRPELEQKYSAPRTTAEEMLAGIWADVLRLEKIGIHDDFFEIGGHSLLATQVISHVRETFSVDIPLVRLFEAPTVKGLAEIIEEAIMAGAGLQAPPITLAPRDQNLPLSFSQQREWVLDQLNPGGASYNIPVALRLQGELNVTALEATISEIIRRHESLRTTFSAVDGSPVQIINPAEPLSLSVVDLSDLPEQEGQQQAALLAADEAKRPFDLARGPLLRAGLIKLADHDHVLLFTLHHIVSDGWSMGVLMKEVAALYEAFSAGKPSPLDELPLQYADFAYWQRQWLQGEVLEAQLKYWRQQLESVPVLEIPTDRPRPPVQTFNGAVEPVVLSKEVTEQIKRLSKREGSTLFMTLLTAMKVLLMRYSGQEDLSVGTFIAGRNRKEVEGLVGFFINNLALRTDLSGGPSFTEALSRVRQVTLAAYAHQDIPFEKVLEDLKPQRDMSRTPLFQVMMVLQNAINESMEVPGLRLSRMGSGSGRSNFDMTLWMTEVPEGLAGSLQYNTDLYEASTIKRLVDHYKKLIESMLSNPDQRITELEMLSEGERNQLLVEWNDTAREYPSQLCIHELFEQQVELSPQAIAVIYEEEEVTYKELNERANRLANYLRVRGVGAESVVGICVERSVEMVVGLLGIMKAGGAYLPLDPQYPKERLSLMIEDAGVNLVLAHDRVLESLPDYKAAIVYVDADSQAISLESDVNPATLADPGNLAYLIYTSGSTGKPKGVMVNHRSASTFLRWIADEFPLNVSDRVLAKYSISFDASIAEIFYPLMTGAGVVVVKPGGQRDIDYLIGLIKRHRVTAIDVVPTLLQAFIDDKALMECDSIRRIICGGEALTEELRKLVCEQMGQVELANQYGPTETAIGSMSFLCNGTVYGGSVPIGRPIANTEVYILDKLMNLASIGSAGEIYIGGEGVTWGYINRPDLTAEKFLPDPFSRRHGGRLYRTGDLGRYLADGSMEFLGRVDDQVKVRGFRIELGEIESALASHARVRETIVLLREIASGEKRLVAYLVVDQENPPGANELKQFLKERLPEYMIPSAFMMLNHMPLTRNGKVDRQALPEPEEVRPETGEDYVAARSDVEQRLADIWAEVLRIDRVGIHDNFFELSGNSLQATQMVSRVRKSMHIDVALAQLFETPTIAGFAQSIEEAIRSGEISQTAPIEAAIRGKQVQLSFAQQRLWFLDQLEPNNPFYNLPSAVRLSGELNKEALEQSFTEIIRRHESLRTIFATVDGHPMQVITDASAVIIPVDDLRNLDEQQRQAQARKLVTQLARTPFNLSQGPLIRINLVRLAEQDHVLVVVMHHIISDGWSIGLLIKELTALYEAYCAGEPSPLEELSVQYADYAMWQREYLQGEMLEQELGYWRKQLEGAPTVLELPTDRPRPAVQTFRGSVQAIALSEEVTRGLREMSRREEVTMFMALMGGFQALLMRYSGQQDIVVGTPIAGRNRIETEELIGFFVNTLVMRTEVRGSASGRELMRRVKEVALGAYAHQEVPFEKLVEELRPERSLSHSPIFQVMMVLQNTPNESAELPGLKMSALSGEGGGGGTARFDMTLSIRERGEELLAAMEYNTDLFDQTTIERMLGHYERLLEGIVKDGEQAVSAIKMLSEAERNQLLVEWNDTAREYPSQLCIHELFEQQVELSPQAIAVIYEEEEVTYKELNERANRLANYLRVRGVGAESVVGICVERSVEMVVGLLGIMKAGGAYLPLDPQYPKERLNWMLSDADVQVLLTQERLLEVLPEQATDVIRLDTDWEIIAGESDENLNIYIPAKSLAYLIYTSGSTGRPKGVVIEHHSLVNYILAASEGFEISPQDRVLQFASISFDTASEEIYPCLTRGATLVLRSELMMSSVPAFLESCRELKLTVLDLPTAYWHFITTELSSSATELPETIRLVIIGGERAIPERLAAWQKQVGQRARLFNTYGPTETTIVATSCELLAGIERAEGQRAVSIGRPIDNVVTYVLDRQMEPVGIGIAGDLYIGGEGVARGYLKRADQTAERFIPDPHSRNGGGRLYKTGDVCRHRANGELEFVGRRDDQVKIRGFRIELGEIETILTQHKGVQDIVVIAKEEPWGDKRLIAYVVFEQGQEQTGNDLRQFLQGKLPQYMIPSLFMFIEKLPLMPNGKVDRRALPAPTEKLPELSRAFVEPRTPTEKTLAGIWADVLKLERVGIYENFFELGGHSLLATQLVLRARDAFQIEIPLRRLFELPTVARLSEQIDKIKSSGANLQTPAIVSVSREAYRRKRSSLVEQQPR